MGGSIREVHRLGILLWNTSSSDCLCPELVLRSPCQISRIRAARMLGLHKERP